VKAVLLLNRLESRLITFDPIFTAKFLSYDVQGLSILMLFGGGIKSNSP
jgi:hypothetical protein